MPHSPGVTVPESFTVVSAHRETSDVISIDVHPSALTPERHSAGNCRPFAPGQFAMLAPFGHGEVPISIGGDPSDHTRWSFTIRAVGKATDALFRLKKGDSLAVRGPFGSCWPLPSAEAQVVIVAGGVGLAALRSLIYALLAEPPMRTRPLVLYGARTPADTLFHAEWPRWRKMIDVHSIVDVADPSWRGDVGVVTKLFDRIGSLASNTRCYVCGPELMMRLSVRSLLQRGASPSETYISLERNMKCALGFCGHCQLGPAFVCKDGPIFSYAGRRHFFETREM